MTTGRERTRAMIESANSGRGSAPRGAAGMRRRAALLAAPLLCAAALVAAAPASADNDAFGYPTFAGSPDPVPQAPAKWKPDEMMERIYEAERDGTDFWMDRLLARRGDDPAGDWLMTRGRAVFMKDHDEDVIGFGGQIAYWESIDNRDGFELTVGDGGFEEVADERLQTPSHFRGEYRSDAEPDLEVEVTKFITHQNVAVANVAITNTGPARRTVALRVTSPYAKAETGDELTGIVEAYNRITTIFPRLSGDDVEPAGDALEGSIGIAAGETVTTKVQMGFVTEEIEQSRREYDDVRDASPRQAYARHVRAYNRWWADNLPYVDLPDENVEKSIYYRWWLMRFNFLDADVPGNDYQFPTSVEGALGYNNAIDLTIAMFIDDLKYLRDPAYSYGPWVSAGEVAENGRYRDNPGDPENWSASHTQYISESAWQAYQVHGGPRAIVENLARYAEKDTYGQLDFFDTDGDWLIDTDWNAWTGNDADAVSFDWRNGRLDRAESAYVYSNALAAAQAYDLLGRAGKAAEMRDVAGRVQEAVLTNLWNDQTKLIEHQHTASGALVPWKEINNYYPFAVGLMPDEPEYKEALRLWRDAGEYPIFPFFTANQADKAEAAEQGHPGSNNFSIINSTVTFRLFSSALRNYESPYVKPEDFKKLLYWNAFAQYVDGDNRWPDANEFWANWNPQTQHVDYRSWIHHTILGTTNWTVIEDVAGLRPRNDTKIELSPIDIGWDHFAVNDINYRGSDLTIVWDAPRDGERHYGDGPEGYSVYVDGKRAFTVDELVHTVYDPRTGEVSFPGERARVRDSRRTDIERVDRVRLRSDRVADMFQKAGRDLTDTGDAENLAADAAPSASFTADGTNVTGAADGFTINVPHWGSEGSGNEEDWYALDFGVSRWVDDVKLYFYNDRRLGGYTEPALYRVQYLDDGEWVDVSDQQKSPTYPRSNYNHVRFDAVRTRQLRVLVRHRDGHSTGLKEVQVFNTGERAREDRNAAPYVLAKQDASYRRPAQARLEGVVEDDGLPAGQLEASWRLVDGPGIALIEDPGASTTVVRFSEGGTYTLELTADDGARESSSRVTVTVEALPDVVNVAPLATPSASYTSPWEDVEAINDAIDPPRSNDTVNPRWGTWPREGTQWVQLDWERPVKVDSADVYFFDDNGGVRVPASWRLQYWDGQAFVDVEGASAYETAEDRYNEVTFDPVTTSRMRLVLESGEASVGLLEWKVWAIPPDRIRHTHVPTLAGELPELPGTVTQYYADGSATEAPVTWEPVSEEQVGSGGTRLNIIGLVDGTSQIAEATVYVRETDAVSITFIEEERLTTLVGVPPALPQTVTATFNDGSRDNVNTRVTWEAVDPSQYAQPGTFTVSGTVAGSSLAATATVTVREEENP
jgi:Bacterial Ig-like domain (group 4)/F5/8 type C domain